MVIIELEYEHERFLFVSYGVVRLKLLRMVLHGGILQLVRIHFLFVSYGVVRLKLIRTVLYGGIFQLVRIKLELFCS